MNSQRTRSRSRSRRLLAMLGLAGMVLAGCGGNEPAASGTAPTEQPAASGVQITESASALSIRTVLATDQRGATVVADSASAPAGGKKGDDDGVSQTQALQFNFKASASGGTTLLQGTLVLRSHSEDGGAVELEGRLVPGAASPAAMPGDAARAAFEAARAELKATLKTAVESAKAAYETARANGEDKAAARAVLRTAITQAMNTYRSALAEAAAAAGLSQREKHGAGGAVKVKGTLKGSDLRLTLQQGRQVQLSLAGSVAQGTLGSADLSGSFTGNANGQEVTGTWTASVATPTDPPVPTEPPVVPPPPANTDCAAATVTWTVGSTSCSAMVPALIHGASATLNSSLAGTTGSVTATCTGGNVVRSNPSCAGSAPPPPPATRVGDAVAGAAKYAASCAGCHGQGKASDSKVNTAVKLTAVLDSVGAHSSVRGLSEQDRLDIAAYVASPK